MNEDVTTAVKVLAALGGISLVVWLGVVTVKAAKRGGGGMKALGAGLLMLGWGTMRDPSSHPVAEAKDGRAEKGSPSGDPLDPRAPGA
jgi:hypothetical protein